MLLLICMLGGCKDEKHDSVLNLFSESQQLFQEKENLIKDEFLAVIEGMTCNEEYLIVYDLHSGDSYTLFDRKTGAYITRFGTIGQGSGEIPAGCYGYMLNKCFSVLDNQTRVVMKYKLDALRSDKTDGENPVRLTKYDIPDSQISRLIAIDDSTFLGAGTYQSRYQYLLFNKNSDVLDYGVDIYNASDESFNQYTKYLSNQGDLVMQPEKKFFAYSLNFSSNLDIIENINGKIKLKKSLRFGNPIYKPGAEADGLYQSVDMTEDTQVGYINLCATTKYLYALYSDKKIYENGRKSNLVLVFDWEGNAIRKYLLDADAHYIAVDEIGQKIFAAVKNTEGGWSIASYVL